MFSDGFTLGEDIASESAHKSLSSGTTCNED
ncbi:hypothetical protein PSEUDO8AS_30227 [Pseudomonas sp. 8AS]|nr:hypothetical protein PSEUDO8AS_30227 [Pseudomonas sp. 8AS]